MRIINVYINAPNLLIIQYICTKKNKRKKKNNNLVNSNIIQ